MSSVKDTASIFRYHRDMIEKHGTGNTSTLGWKAPENQKDRFKILATVADLNNHSVLDAGCGHGDLCEYLHKLYPDVKYMGMEQIPELLDVAVKRYNDWPETTFMQGNFLSPAMPFTDYIIVCGSLNYHHSDPEYIYKAISKLYDNCRYALAFNLLSNIAENGLIMSYNKAHILSYCQTLSKNVILKDDYTDDDFTIFMYH
ncbi:class I SAM-dependent methyltransferase [Mucilaginibacter sp. KACC 22063]|uniref:class I SAM-dependent methyltransferase n=1 Tax=Mucilaginibacter sp. KACC 22063 TaxID=3025666 RepID=UPI0023665F98|nr:class I SAM-dependent methyltransferase [Mucilaginibacter sp. KACC 22063]WDF53802.1 class I SAM-dependent methyltransferase [Mucilaginibacter sp. KACC 22063]